MSIIDDLAKALSQPAPLAVPFTPRAEVLLARHTDPTKGRDEMTEAFEDYFAFRDYAIDFSAEVDPALVKCGGGYFPTESVNARGCVALAGRRGSVRKAGPNFPDTIGRLFVGDLLWLFFMERLGTFKISGAILDDFATKGRYPLPRDGFSAFLLETMVRETKMGLSSTVRDRDSTYRRCLGWTSDVGARVGSEALTNTEFNAQWHKLVTAALEFYRDKRLAVAIQGASNPAIGRPSVATLITIRDTIKSLRNAIDPFEYGRTYVNTLNGIVWAIASLILVRELRSPLGIPNEYRKAEDYVPAAYERLVLGGQKSRSESSRFITHRDCAISGRNILLDVSALDVDAPGFSDLGGPLDQWLTAVEGDFEGYRTAYRALTGVDLGNGPAKIEQAAA